MQIRLTARSALITVLLYPILAVSAGLLARILFGGAGTAQEGRNIDEAIGTGMHGTIIASIVLAIVSIYVFKDSRRDIYFERKPFALSKLYYLFPLAWAGVALFALLNVDFSAYSYDVILRVGLASLAIAINEEVLDRGILLVGLRNSRFAEWQAWLITMVVFSLSHLVNVLGGDSPIIVLIVATGGVLLYVARRVFNNLFVPILLHAFYDAAFLLLTGKYMVGESLPDNVLDLQLGSFLVLLTVSILLLVFGRNLLASKTTGWEAPSDASNTAR